MAIEKKWIKCTQGDGEIYLDLSAAIAIRPLGDGGSLVYFAAADGNGKFSFSVAEDPDDLIGP
jgi:hypothetical protein